MRWAGNRIAFRRILPIVQLVLFIALLSVGKAQEDALSARFEAARAGQAKTAGGAIAWDLRTLSHYYGPVPVVVCESINLPAILVAGALELLFPEMKWLSYVGAAIAVAGLWYLLGLWLDRRLGLLPPGTRRPRGSLVRVLAWVALIILGGFSVIVFAFLLLGETHHGWPTLVARIALMVWSAFGAMIFGLRIREWRKMARAGVAS